LLALPCPPGRRVSSADLRVLPVLLGYDAGKKINASWVSEKAVSKHINSIFTKLDLPPSEDDHRRVLAVLTYLGG